MQPMNILLVEDYRDLQQALTESLQRLQHQVVSLGAAEEVDAALAEQPADVALVDLNLPKEDGLSLIKRLRHTHPDMGIIVISGRDSTLARVSGYQSGADLYLTKPVVNEELFAAIGAVGRRLKRRADAPAVAEPPGVQLDTTRMEVVGPDARIRLTTTEYTLLAALARNGSRPLETARIYQLLGREPGQKSALEALVYRVRRKLAQAGAGSHSIRAHRMQGYQLSCRLRIV